MNHHLVCLPSDSVRRTSASVLRGLPAATDGQIRNPVEDGPPAKACRAKIRCLFSFAVEWRMDSAFKEAANRT